ncbi:PLP-dependent aminotransferase family protein [Trinickia fusca]|uniref:PLP-dependent aminotransferase family protein n=1 Tax=Trinickia fusca TaxID=2419777 RepID=A0A494X1J3_9BURK|nr:PLP-dependent aminotransferase family protein [Trinickia fusca]RKP43511.1 PLP-dependent aminotransferase family protein [Trinickia fusca]
MEPVFAFPLDLDKHDGEGRAQRLHHQLRAAILEGRLTPGTELPATRRVATAYGIARNTVIAAYDLLMAEGYLLTRPGAKAVVADVTPAQVAVKRKRLPRERRQNTVDWLALAPRREPPANAKPEPAAFQLGVPEHRYFPLDVWRRLLVHALPFAQPAAFGYPPTEGQPLLRAAIAQHAGYARAVACDEHDVLVTTGAQQAFDLLARVFVTRGQTKVAVEDPGYPPLCTAMLAAGAQLVPIPVDDEGICVDHLTSDIRIVYVTPSHQFPTGVPMSMKRRHALLEFARKNGALIIEDDYDGEFRYGSQPLDALQTLDRDSTVAYVGTFSKSLFPSLRIGYIVAPAWALDMLIAAKHCTDSAGNVQVQDALARFILEGHLARHVRKMRKHYALRREAMLASFADELAPWFEAVPALAGIHLCARYRDRREAGRILTQTRQHAIGAQPVSDFLLERRSRASSVAAGDGIAFGFGRIEAEDISAAMKRLSRALKRA